MSLCPSCGYHNIIQSDRWSDVGFIPLECESCDTLYCAKLSGPDGDATVVLEEDGHQEFEEEIPELPIGSPVILKNTDHPLHEVSGIVVDKDHKHYRVEFDLDSKIILWCPEEWIETA